MDLLTEQQIEQLKVAFSLFDKDGDGVVTTKELGTLMRSLGQNPADRDLEAMINEVDIDGNGTIDFPEFLSLMAQEVQHVDSMDELIAAFSFFDKNESGWLHEDEFTRVMLSLGEKLSREEVSELISQAKFGKDVWCDHEINY